jgi:hypothetical protein
VGWRCVGGVTETLSTNRIQKYRNTHIQICGYLGMRECADLLCERARHPAGRVFFGLSILPHRVVGMCLHLQHGGEVEAGDLQEGLDCAEGCECVQPHLLLLQD